MKHYNRNNCQAIVRLSIIDQWGRRVTMVGRHAFEWSICIEHFGKITVTSYPNSKEAKKVFNTLKKKR